MGRAPASDHQVHGGDVCETPQRKCGHLSVNELFLFFSPFSSRAKKNGKRIFVEEREKYFHCQTAVRTHTHQTEPSTLAITWNRPRNVQKAATSIFPPSGHYSGLNTHLIDL